MVAIVQVMTDEHIHLTQELFAEYFDFLRTAVDNTVDDLEVVPLLAGYREGLPFFSCNYIVARVLSL